MLLTFSRRLACNKPTSKVQKWVKTTERTDTTDRITRAAHAVANDALGEIL